MKRKIIIGGVILLCTIGGYLIYQSLTMVVNEPVVNYGPGTDNDENNLICTDDARQCDDGSIVGRVGPYCEFEVCSGGTPAPASQVSSGSTLTEDNPIKLPDNVITEKNCIASGGEVWNTLGETSYNGRLIGKIEGLKCPCVCLVK